MSSTDKNRAKHTGKGRVSRRLAPADEPVSNSKPKPMIKNITKDILLSIKQDMNDALKAVGKKYGVDILPAGGTYADKNATIKVTISVIDDKGETVSKGREDLDWAVKAGILDKRFAYGALLVIPSKTGKRTWRLVGYKPRSSKLLMDGEKGKNYMFDAQAIKDALDKGVVTISNPS